MLVWFCGGVAIAGALIVFAMRLTYLKLAAIVAAAKLALDEKRADIAKMAPALEAASAAPALTLEEIMQVLELLDLEAEVLTTIKQTLSARLEEKMS